MESLLALRRENKEVLWSSMIKDTMKRKKPSFNEAYHGYRTFSELLEDAQKEGLLELDTDKRSRTYVVTRFGSELKSTPATPPTAKKATRRRRSSGRKRGQAAKVTTVTVPPTEPVQAEVWQEETGVETKEAPEPPPPQPEEQIPF
jgi:hypothetical protein